MLRWAVLGTGFISDTVIAAIALSDASRVDVLAGRDPARTEEMRSRHGILRSASYEQAITDPDIDAVYIGLPNHQHHTYAIAASQAGKAVLSEKSMTTTMADAHAIAAQVQDQATFFVEGLMYLAHPLIQTFVDVLADGRLGQLRSINACYGANIAHLANPAGRGTIYNLGCYPVSLTHLVVHELLGPDAFAKSDLAAVGETDAEHGTVTNAAAAIRFAGGAVATIQSSDNYGNASEFSVAGDNGVLRFATNPWLPVAGHNLITWQPYGADLETVVVTDDHDAFYHQIKMVERHIAAGDTEAERPSPRLSDSLEIMQLLTSWETLCLAT